MLGVKNESFQNLFRNYFSLENESDILSGAPGWPKSHMGACISWSYPNRSWIKDLRYLYQFSQSWWALPPYAFRGCYAEMVRAKNYCFQNLFRNSFSLENESGKYFNRFLVRWDLKNRQSHDRKIAIILGESGDLVDFNQIFGRSQPLALYANGDFGVRVLSLWKILFPKHIWKLFFTEKNILPLFQSVCGWVRSQYPAQRGPMRPNGLSTAKPMKIGIFGILRCSTPADSHRFHMCGLLQA